MRFLRMLTFPIALIYGCIVYLRNWLYDLGVFRSQHFELPIICVGNLSVGGTGKTPMVDFLVSSLKPNYKITVLSRGYRRKSKGFQMANDFSNAEVLGDEPFQLFRKHPDITIAVNADRINGIREIQKRVHADVIILDDAYQHRRVKPHFSILLTTYRNPFPNDFYLPMGDLRDAKNQYKRADVIVVTKCPENLADTEIYNLRKSIKARPGQALVFSYLKYDEVLKSDKGDLKLADIAEKDIALVTGIANPAPLVDHLKSKGLNFEHYEFRDHHFFSEREVEKFRKHEMVLTTEKDYARLGNRLHNICYLPVSHRFLKNGESELINKIDKKLNLRTVTFV